MHNDYHQEFNEWLLSESSRASKPGAKNFVGDRPYRHFDSRISIKSFESNEAEELIKTLQDPKKLSKHSFYPFIRKDKKVRRFTREHRDDGTKKLVIDQKIRPIMYASHKDACIYGFYAYMLKAQYNTLIKNTAIDEAVIAYRKIPRTDNSGRNKSNVDFANDIYTCIKKTQNCAVLCVDIKGFFNNMQHDNILKSWENILNVKSLPTSYSIIFRSITNFRYAFSDEVLAVVGEGSIKKNRFRYFPDAKRRGIIGNPKIYNKLINNTPLIHKNRSSKGIPQGSPISDIIANMYMLEFDRRIITYLEGISANSLYRRYSDDILIVCPQSFAVEAYEMIQSLLKAPNVKLGLSHKKTELFFVDNTVGSLSDKTKLVEPGYSKNKTVIQYLGFEFDLNDLNIRSGTVANHYRKITKIAKKISDNSDKSPNTAKKPKLPGKKRDWYQYLKQAINKTNSKRITRQLSNVKRRTKKILTKANSDKKD